MISIFQLSPGNRLLRIEQNGVASSEKEANGEDPIKNDDPLTS